MVNKILPKFKTSPKRDEEDSFSNLVGQFGRWQLLIFGSIFIVKIPTGWIQLSILFLTPKTTFWCLRFENRSMVGSNGTCYADCLEYAYDSSPMESSIISEWGLICERAWLASFTQTMLQLGILIGSVIFGFLADRYGRQRTFLLGVWAVVGLGVGVPFSPDYITFTVLRFLLGLATAGVMVVSFVLIMEAIGPSYREICGGVFQLPFVVGHLLVPLVAYYFRNWSTYLLVLGVSNVIFLAYTFLVKESPRWLLSVGRVDDAAVIVSTAAQMNKLPTENIHQALSKLSLEMRSNANAPRLNYSALLRPGLRMRTFISLLMWLVAGHTFFGFNQYIGQTSSDPYLSVAVAAVVQFPGDLSAIWLTRQFGRKWTTVGGLVVSGASIIALGVLPRLFWVQLLLAAFGSGAAGLTCTCVYIYSSELFPTVARNMGVGVSSMAMRVGSMVAPFVASLDTQAQWLPTFVFGATPLAAAAAVLLLPETRGKKLPDTIEDVQQQR